MDTFSPQAQSRKVDQLHFDTRHWRSGLQFTGDEMIFIKRLINSYVFEPNTPNLFERLRDYQDRLERTRLQKKEVLEAITKHERDLGGMLECMDSECDLTYYRKHEQLRAEVTSFQEDFRQLKSEIFNYAGGILKKRKPL